MTTFTLCTKEETSVSNLSGIILGDPEDVTKIIVESDGKVAKERDFLKVDATQSILNNFSYTVRKAAGWVNDLSPRAGKTSAPSSISAPAGKEKVVNQNAPKAGVFKLATRFDLVNGLAYIKLGENGEMTYTSSDDMLHIEANMFVRKWTRKIEEFACSVRSSIASSTEVGVDGKVIREGWSLGTYTSDKELEKDAILDIVQKAFSAKDMAFMMENNIALMQGELHPTRTGGGVKNEWLEKYMPLVVSEEPKKDEPKVDPKADVETSVEELVDAPILEVDVDASVETEEVETESVEVNVEVDVEVEA